MQNDLSIKMSTVFGRKILIEAIATCIGTVALVGMVGILFDIEILKDWNFISDMAFPTSINFVMISIALWLCAQNLCPIKMGEPNTNTCDINKNYE